MHNRINATSLKLSRNIYQRQTNINQSLQYAHSLQLQNAFNSICNSLQLYNINKNTPTLIHTINSDNIIRNNMIQTSNNISIEDNNE